jgi:hypothetical protein
MIRRLALGFAALVLGAGLATADEGHEHAHDHSAKHGGIVEHTSHHHLELVAKGGNLELYVRHEDGEDEDATGAKATATVLADGKTEQVTLTPAGGNSLKGSGSFTAGKGTTVVVSLTMPDHEPSQVRFKLD